jgi:hypothetical protein
MKKNIIAKILCLLFILTTISGCGKEAENGTTSEDEAVSVSVNITGVSDEESSSTKASENSNKKILQFGGGTQITSSIVQDKASSTKSSTETALDDSVTYRVIVYKNSVSTSNWIASKQFTVGSTSDNIFTLTSGGTYVFVCYSFNNTSNLSFDGSTGNILSDVSGDEDLLYEQTSMNITNGTGASQNVLNIVFGHEFSRLRVIFNSEIGNITALSNLSFSPHYSSANLDLSGSTALTYNGSPSTKNFTIPTTLGSASVETDYSLFCLPSSSGTLTIGSITANGTTKSDLSLNYSIEPGKSYTITLTLTGLTVYGATWAPGNLIYNSATEIYAFATADAYGDYWFPDYLKPRILDSNWIYQSPNSTTNGGSGDPCKKVLPEGTWRMPSKAEISAPGAYTPTQTGSTSYNEPNRYQAAHYDSSDATTNPGLFFGIQVDPGINRVNYLFFPYGGACFTNYPPNGLGTIGYYLSYDSTNGYQQTQLGNIWTVQTDPSSSSTAYSIRCVRN